MLPCIMVEIILLSVFIIALNKWFKFHVRGFIFVFFTYKNYLFILSVLLGPIGPLCHLNQFI